MSRQSAIEFFLARREDLAQKTVKFGLSIFRLRVSRTSDDPIFFKAKRTLEEMDGVEKVIDEFFGQETCSRFMGIGSLLDHVKKDNIRLSKLAIKIRKTQPERGR